jgi:hypothetical protein
MKKILFSVFNKQIIFLFSFFLKKKIIKKSLSFVNQISRDELPQNANEMTRINLWADSTNLL